MSRADQYRCTASECSAITQFFTDPQQRATVLALAKAWTRLAEEAERNERMVPQTAIDTPPKACRDDTD
jgi:hypothetical protein